MNGPIARFAALSFLLGLVSYPRAARAQAEGGNSAAAAALFRAGREAIRSGQKSQACGYFRESQRLESMLGTQLNLALCERELGNLVTAWHLASDLVHAPDLDEARRGIVKQLLSGLEGQLAFLILEQAANLPSATRVRLPHGEVSLDAFGVAFPLEPGTLNVEVVAPGHKPRRSRVQLAAGERRRILVAVGPPLRSPQAPAAPKSMAHRTPWAAITAGVAGAGFVASGVLGLQALQEKRAMSRECDPLGCSELGMASAARGGDFAQASTLTFVAASLSLGASVLIHLLSGRDAPYPAAAGSGLTFHY